MSTKLENSTGSPATGPVGTPSHKRVFQGPCYLKMLVSNLVAGSIIGKNGAVINTIENKTGASMKLSPTGSFFPGTSERVVVMSGLQEQVTAAMAIILEKVGEVTTVQYAPSDSRDSQVSRVELKCSIAVPKSAVSGIIGKAGQQIKQLQEQSGAKIQISNREQGLNERVVTISGPLNNIHNAAIQICTVIQDDAHLKDHVYVSYNGVHGPSNMGHVGLYNGVGGGTGSVTGGFGGYAPYGQSPTGGSYGGYGPYPGIATTGPQDLMEHCEMFIEIRDECMGPVIGKSGMHLIDIMRSTGATIKVSEKGDFLAGTQNRKVTISGSVQSVHRAHIRLLYRLKETNQNLATRSRVSTPGGQSYPASMQVGAAAHSQQVSPVAAYSQYGMHVPQQYQIPAYQYGQY